ncbi:lysophospholipid acyltransferase family protein [Entomomonas asaccharolytica]|uniref:1-acyl-sn-glycerol-3-phosphate acyltransferase n=1 Tax=Entomomonas asaccharolytica TaxID=2785331 RepID=A0A974RXE1_9GAMM|nr:lysophospholipid acyltransferase family protein [Entomomonas asaccharolytica]QQP86092.1 1-acyl-sn-glycerol-3-phosphate acyltransferase [Entomomonas asaccharolytica]
MLAKVCSKLLIGFAKALTGARCVWKGCNPEPKQRIYYANHTSHADFVLIWAALPPKLRNKTRPVAAADYWSKTKLHRFMIHKMFRGVLVDRIRKEDSNPLEPMLKALAESDSLIIFPEGTRNKEEQLLPFKSGIYNLAEAYPNVEIVPVWLDNLKRVMPKGHLIPLPVLCSLTMGEPIQVEENETRQAFLERARDTLIALGKGE